MDIKTIKVGSLQTNCYIVIDESTQQALIIDPGDDAHKILPQIKNLKVKYIIITHGHPDHFEALDDVKAATKATVLMHADDNWFIKPDQTINNNDKIQVGNIEFTVIHTPGHSKGGICLYTPGHLFSGDTLFWHTYGRTDLPGSSEAQMQASLKRLGDLPDQTKVYPGHGYSSTIKEEKEALTIVP